MIVLASLQAPLFYYMQCARFDLQTLCPVCVHLFFVYWLGLPLIPRASSENSSSLSHYTEPVTSKLPV